MISNRAKPLKGPHNFGNDKAGLYLQDVISERSRFVQAKVAKQIRRLQTVINDCQKANNSKVINTIVKQWCLAEASKPLKDLLPLEISLMRNIIQTYANTKLNL